MIFVLLGLGYYDYEGVVLCDEEKFCLVVDLGLINGFLMLCNYGLLMVGCGVFEVFL